MDPVLIVGGGPTGLVAAALLRRYGVGCVVVERYGEPYPLPRAVHLDDEVCRILQQVGVAAGFAGISRAADGMRLLDAGHRTMAEFARSPTGPHGYPQANLFDQPDLERLLRANLAAPSTSDGPGGTVALRYGTELVRLEQPAAGGGPVRVLLREAGGGERWAAARAVLGCDGANSTVRDAIGARLLDLGFRERWLVVDVRCAEPLDVWGGVEQVCDPHRAATFMRIGPDRYRWEFRLSPTETAEELTTQLPSLLGPWTGDVPADRLAVLRHAEYTFTAQVADRWRDRDVFLLGDAAHQTPPFIGQGLGAGLRDAANLTWKLAHTLHPRAAARTRDGQDGRVALDGRADRGGGDGGDALLDTYQAEREPHARRMIRAAVLAGWAMTGGQDRAAAVRRVALAGLCRLPGFTKVTQRTLSPRLDRGPLVRRAPLLPTGLAGCLLPQPWVTVSAGPGRSGRPGGIAPDRTDSTEPRQPGRAERGGAERGGAEQGGAKQGGAKQGGAKQGGAKQGGAKQGGAAQSGAKQGGAAQSGSGRIRLDEVLGDGFAILTRGTVSAGLAELADLLGARIVALAHRDGDGADVALDRGDGAGGAVVVLAEDGGLGRWLRRGRAGAVLVRPDRIVLAAGRPAREVGADLCRAAARWLPALRD